MRTSEVALAGGGGTAVGQPASEDSFVGGSGAGGQDWQESIGGYDDSYDATSESWVIPSGVPGGLAWHVQVRLHVQH